MKLVWVVIPLVLIGIIGIQESFAETEIIWKNSVTASNDKVIATLATDKKDYSDGELIHIQWSLENVGTDNISYKRIGCPAQRHFDLEIFRSGNFPVNYNLGQLVPKDDISEPPCFEVEYGPPFIPPNGKIHNELIWTQKIRSFENFENITPGNYILRITFYESEQQWHNNEPSYLELQINIQGFSIGEYDVYNLSLDYGIINIPYNIENGFINQITIGDKSPSIKIPIESINDGLFSIDIKKFSRFIDLGFGDIDDIFVLVDGKETKFEHYKTSESLILNFSFNSNSNNLEIAASSIERNMPGPPESWMNHKLLKFDKIHSPYHQIKNNVDSEDIICNSNKELVFRPITNSPVCINGDSILKLIDRDWLKPENVCTSGQPQDPSKFEEGFEKKLLNLKIEGEVDRYYVNLHTDWPNFYAIQWILDNCHDTANVSADTYDNTILANVPIDDIFKLTSYNLIEKISNNTKFN